MITKRILTLTLVSLLAQTSWAGNGESAGSTLIRANGARPSGLGSAYVAVAEDLNAVGFNPAALSGLQHPELQATYLRGLVEDNFGFLGYGHPISFLTLFAGGIYFDAGDVDLNLSNGFQGSRKAQQDTVGMIGLSLGRKGPVSVGGIAKSYKFELAEAADATGFAFDAGLHIRTPVKGFHLGASVQNIGDDVKFEQAGDPLPTTTRFGGHYFLDLDALFRERDFPYQIRLAVDGVQVKEEDGTVHAGLEISRKFFSSLASGDASVRGGYIADPETITVGAGMVFGFFKIDYALHLLDELDDSHRVTLSLLFKEKRQKKSDSFNRRRLKN